MNYSFTQTEILTAIANWKQEPFTLQELNFLLNEFTFTDYPQDNADISFGENDIESLILHRLSEMDIEEPTQEQFVDNIKNFITNQEHYKEFSVTTKKHVTDQYKFETHDPDGDYERVIITIDLIP